MAPKTETAAAPKPAAKQARPASGAEKKPEQAPRKQQEDKPRTQAPRKPAPKDGAAREERRDDRPARERKPREPREAREAREPRPERAERKPAAEKAPVGVVIPIPAEYTVGFLIGRGGATGNYVRENFQTRVNGPRKTLSAPTQEQLDGALAYYKELFAGQHEAVIPNFSSETFKNIGKEARDFMNENSYRVSFVYNEETKDLVIKGLQAHVVAMKDYFGKK